MKPVTITERIVIEMKAAGPYSYVQAGDGARKTRFLGTWPFTVNAEQVFIEAVGVYHINRRLYPEKVVCA